MSPPALNLYYNLPKIFVQSIGLIYLRTKSDADILRDAKLEALGIPPAQDNSPLRTTERTQMATYETVSVPYSY